MKINIDENKFIFQKVNITDILYADFIDRLSLYEHMIRMKKYINGKTLDFGCGRKPYKSLFNCDEFIGIDTKSSGHGWSDKDKFGPDVFYDGKVMPFEKNIFDTVISTQVFEHVEDIQFTMSEIKRVMKVEGILIVTVPMAEEEHEIPYDFRRYTEIGLQQLMSEYGLMVIESGKINSWKNSLRVLEIGRLCHDVESTIWSKVEKYLYIIYANICRILFGNVVTENQLFSNKIYCVAKKVSDN